MRTAFSFLIVLFVVSTFNITTSFAQQAPEVQRLEHPREITSLVYSSDSATIATGCRDGRVRLWDVETGTIRRTLEHPNVDFVYEVAYSPDDTMLASASNDWKVRLWNVETGAIIRTFTGHNSEVRNVTYSPDGTTLASADENQTLIIWDAATGTRRYTFKGAHEPGLTIPGVNLVYSPDSATLVSGYTTYLNLWDVATGTRRHRLQGSSIYLIGSIYSPNGTTLAGPFLDNIKIWDAATGTLLHTLAEPPNSGLNSAYSPDSLTLISGGGSSVHVWDVATGSLIDILQSDQHVAAVAYSPDGTLIASGGYRGYLSIWDAKALTRIHVLSTGITGVAHWPVYSPDSATLAGWGSSNVFLWRFTPPPPPIIFTPSEVDDQTFTLGTPVSLTLPTATGGTPPYTYTLAPTLPLGLSFDPIANGPGYISGTPIAVTPATRFTYTATDATGAFADLTFTIEVIEERGVDPLDINGDGRVDVLDLVWVAVSYGMRGNNLPADVNADGVINVQDLVAVAAAIDAGAVLPTKIAEDVLFAAEAPAAEFEAGAGAPVIGFNTPRQTAYGINAYGNVADALADARAFAGDDVRLGKWMPLLEELLHLLTEMQAIPDTTALLPNYPNPFNPETWIPYHLATAANVTVTLHDVRGSVVRELALGHQSAGVYESRGRAAYWDGKNQIGEKVASGLYFYTLTAGDFNATRKLLIAK